MLTIVPTPIGNIGDMTYRAVEVLKNADLILAEDTRTSMPLLRHYDIRTPLMSYHKFNERERIERILGELAEGKKIALISDAGMPLVSDPGETLVTAVYDAGYEIEVFPGASASIVALVRSGFGGGPFYFHGFLSRRSGGEDELMRVAAHTETVILYESPKRMKKTVAKLAEKTPERKAAVLRELTKKFEERIAGSLAELADTLPDELRGETVLVLAPFETEADAKSMLYALLEDGMRSKDAIRAVAEATGESKNKLYDLALAWKRDEA